MFQVALFTMLALFLACVGGLLVIAIHDWMIEDRPHRARPDALATRVRAAFDPEDTRTGRVRSLLSAMASREADAAGRRRQPAGLHRATP